MKKLLILCLLTGILFSIFGQAKKEPAEVTKNKLEAGAIFGNTFNSAEIPVSTIGFTVPFVKYNFESVQKETNKFFLTGEFGYDMSKTTWDGEAPEGMDVYASRMFLNIDPMMRLYLSKKMFEQQKKKKMNLKEEKEEEEWDEGDAEVDNKNRWFVAAGLPVSYENVTQQYEDAEAVIASTVDITAYFGYDDKTVDIKKLSPWASFEEGIFGQGILEYRITESYDGESPEQTPITIGAEGDYSYDMGNYVSNSFVKAFMSLKYQIATDAVQVFPWEYTMGYMGTYLDFAIGFAYAQDYTDMVNMTASVTGRSWQLDDEDKNSINSLDIKAAVNYYPMPELNINAGIGMLTHLKEKDSEPDISLTLGASYTFDFIEIKKNAGKKKAEEEEPTEEEW